MTSNNLEAIELLKDIQRLVDTNEMYVKVKRVVELLQADEVEPVEMFNCELCGTRLPKGLWVKHPHSEGNELTPPKPSSKVEKLKELADYVKKRAIVDGDLLRLISILIEDEES